MKKWMKAAIIGEILLAGVIVSVAALVIQPKNGKKQNETVLQSDTESVPSCSENEPSLETETLPKYESTETVPDTGSDEPPAGLCIEPDTEPSSGQTAGPSTEPTSGSETVPPTSESATAPPPAGSREYRGVTLPIPASYTNARPSAEQYAAHGSYEKKNTGGQKILYLTFCLGSNHETYTAQALDILKAKGVQTVFFVVGRENVKNGALYQRMESEGHLIGSHGSRHVLSQDLNDEALVDNILNCEKDISDALGHPYKVQFYRPPEGSVTLRDIYCTAELGMTTVGYSWNYFDYDLNNQMSAAEALVRMKSTALSPGQVIYLHARPSSVNALGDFIDYARSQGYEFRRLDQ